MALRAAAGRRLRRRGRAREEVRQGRRRSAYEAATSRGSGGRCRSTTAMFVAAYREDLFKKASLKVPDTWEDLYTVGKELKKMGQPGRDPHQPELRLDLDGGARPVVASAAWRSTRTARPSRSTRRGTVQMVEWYKKMYSDCMEAEVLSWSRRQQQRVDPAGQGRLDPQSGQRLHRRQAAQAGDRRRHQPPPEPGRAQRPPRDRRPALHRHLEVLQEHRAREGVDPATCSARRRRTTSTSCRATPSTCRPTRSCRTIRSCKTDPEVRGPQGRRRAVPRLRLAGARPPTRSSSSPTRTSCPTCSPRR